MYCHKCGAAIPDGARFCEKCGAPVLDKAGPTSPLGNNQNTQFKSTATNASLDSPNWAKRIGWGLVAIFIIGSWIWSARDQQAVTTNNTAIGTFNSSDSADSTQQVIQQLQSAYSNATDNATKLNTLKNLAIAYTSDGNTVQAISTFQKALDLASQSSSDYYFISAEIAQLRLDPATALANFKQAYALNPQDYQINNELGLFYLDMSGSWTSYDDNAKALQYLKAAHNEQVTDSSASNLAIAYYYNNDYQQTISLLTPLNLANHPTYVYWIGRAYAAEKDSTNAKLYFQKGIDAGGQVPQDVTNYMNSH